MQRIKTGLLITIIVLGYGVTALAAPPLLTVVTEDDYFYELLKKYKFPRLDIASDAISNSQNLLSRRVDLIPSYALSLSARLRQMGKPFHVVENALILIPTEPSKLYMALSRGTDPEIIAQIKTAFTRAQAEDVIGRALNEYLEGIK